MGHAAGVVQRVQIAVDLGAERAVREGVLAIAAQADGAPVLDVSSHEQVSGQSSGQAPRTVVRIPGEPTRPPPPPFDDALERT